MSDFYKAEALLREFKGDSYVHGSNVLRQVGTMTLGLGTRPALVKPSFPGHEALVETIATSLSEAGLQLCGEVQGAAPNAPREDLLRITGELEALDPDVIICLGGGSTLDATKAAEVLRTLGGEIDDYFGTDQVTEKLRRAGKTLTPVVAIQTAASSAAHLTKYSNITDLHTGQKKLIVDEAIVPTRAIFDYAVTKSMPADFTADGALDGVAHALEVVYSAVGTPAYEKAAEIAEESIRLVVNHVQAAVEDPENTEARTALGLATDLGGYAIMIGGTNGGHLTSFSLVDLLSHGRACAIMNPYYTVFFAPAVEEPLNMIGKIYRDAGLTDADFDRLSSRQIGEAVAMAMMSLSEAIGFPTKLCQVPGFTDEHISRALAAAKNPQLKMKLENMPIPLTADMIDEYMGPVLYAARNGDLDLIKNV
jgi:alcohol dehydrogenase